MYIKKSSIILVVIALFFIRIPSFYILPIQSTLSLSHNLARLLLLLASLISIFVSTKRSKHINYYVGFAFLFFSSSTISFLFSLNYSSYLSVYKDIIFVMLVIFIIYKSFHKHDLNYIIQAIYASSLVNLILQGLYFLFPEAISSFMHLFLHQGSLDFFMYQAGRQRFFGDSFDEIFTCLFVLNFLSKKTNTLKFVNLLVVIGIFIITLLSNWRSKIVLFFFSFFFGVYYYIQSKLRFKSDILYKFVLLSLILIIVGIYVAQNNHNTSIKRITEFSESNNSMILSRFDLWESAVDIGKHHSIFGVGFGNFYEYLDRKTKENNQNNPQRNTLGYTKPFIVIDDPHNIFFSTFSSLGIIGLAILVLNLVYWLIFDLRVVKFQMDKKNHLSLFVAFWTLFLYALFNPWLYFSFLIPFWLLRTLIFIIYD